MITLDPPTINGLPASILFKTNVGTSLEAFTIISNQYIGHIQSIYDSGGDISQHYSIRKLTNPHLQEWTAAFACLGLYRDDVCVGFWDIPTASFSETPINLEYTKGWGAYMRRTSAKVYPPKDWDNLPDVIAEPDIVNLKDLEHIEEVITQVEPRIIHEQVLQDNALVDAFESALIPITSLDL